MSQSLANTTIYSPDENATFVVRFPSEDEADESALVVNQVPFNTSWHLIILGNPSKGESRGEC